MKTTLKIILMSLLISFGSISSAAELWNGHDTDKSWYRISETEFHISSAAQLKGLADLVNNDEILFEGCTVFLDSDIDLCSQNWIPIGYGYSYDGTHQFKGSFDGCGYTITNLNISMKSLPVTTTPNLGLFGTITGTISNLNLFGRIILDDRNFLNSAQLMKVGGVCGSGGDITDSSFNIDLISTFSIRNATFISLSQVAGSANNITRVKVAGDVSLTSSYCGNFGSIASLAANVSECESKAKISLPLSASSDWTNIGGLVGRAQDISNCIFSGDFEITGRFGDGYIGGIAASASSIRNAIFAPNYSLNNVSMDNPWALTAFVKAVCGSVNNSDMHNCYYLSDIGFNDANAIPISKSDLIAGSALPNYDSSIWSFTAGKIPSLKSLAQTYIIDIPIDNGYIGFLVTEGESISVSVDPDEGWKVNSFFVDGIDCTADLIGNKFRFENVEKNHVVNAVFTDISAVRFINESDYKPSFSMDGNNMIISNLNPNDTIKVFTLDGKLEKVASTSTDNCILQLECGIHVVYIGDISYKIMIK